MADKVLAKASESMFRLHDEGQFLGQCIDVVDVGEDVIDYPNKDKYTAPKCAIVFRTEEVNPETGQFLEISQEFTVSMGERANLRKFLESWRGKPYSDEQAREGVPVDRLEKQYGMLSIAHKKSGKGKTYAYIQTIVPVPKRMQGDLPDMTAGYKRAPFWATRKQEYAKNVAAFHGAPVSNGASQEYADYPDQHPDDDSDSEVPF